MSDTPKETKPAAPQTALQTLIALIVLAAGTVAYVYVAPSILPVSIKEGPLVQQATPSSAIVVWYTTKPAQCEFRLDGDTGSRQIDVTQGDNGVRHVVRFDGLSANTTYGYEIESGGRVLGEFKLRSAKQAGTPYRFVVFGDSGKPTQAQYLIAGLMREQEPDFALHTGDLVYSDGARHRYPVRFFAPYREMISEVAFWPCLGNHDVDKDGMAAPYVSVFELPENGPAGATSEHHYWFDYADTRIAVIDSNVSEAELAEKIAPWLREVMSAAGPTWRFVSMHHPPYTGGKYEPDIATQRAIVPVFEEVGVDIVFLGHDHMYQHIKPMRANAVAEDGSGVHYVITGAGGARLYSPRDETLPDYVDTLYDDKHSFTVVDVDGATLSITQINIDGETIDTWRLRKETAGSHHEGHEEHEAE